MTKKSLVLLAGSAVAIAAIVVVASPLFSESQENSQAAIPSASPIIAEFPPAQESGPSVNEDTLTAPLAVQVADGDSGGFRLQLAGQQDVRIVKTIHGASAVVHAVQRHRYEDKSGEEEIELYAVVVYPETREVRVFSLYAEPLIRTIGHDPFVMLDGRRALFVKQSAADGKVTYDLAALDIEDGQTETISEHFWVLDPQAKEQADDFLVSSHFAPRDQGGQGEMMLTSFKGRIFYIDVATGKVRTDNALYPAYGDPGSAPTRELVYPSPDHRRFVHQERYTSHFQVIDTADGRSLAAFGFGDDTALMEPGIGWSPDGSVFYLESGSWERALGIPFDNGYSLYAEAVNFYDRDGKAIRTLKRPPEPDNLRMNVYGWADSRHVWMTYFRTVPQEQGDPIKTDLSYKLYDIETGKLMEYKMAEDLTKLNRTSIVSKQILYGPSDRTPVLFVDEGQRLVWQPPPDEATFFSGDKLYMQGKAGEGAENDLLRWDAASRSWQWLHGDKGEEYNGETRYVTPTIFRNRWMVYARDYSDQVDYVPIVEQAADTAAKF